MGFSRTFEHFGNEPAFERTMRDALEFPIVAEQADVEAAQDNSSTAHEPEATPFKTVHYGASIAIHGQGAAEWMAFAPDQPFYDC